MRQLKIIRQITDRQNDSINRYFHEISKYELIPAEEEAELAARIKKGDMDAMERLVTANLRFVVSVAKQYQYKGLSLPDLINEGNVGLVKAAYKFDPTRGFKFISYAVWWIRQSIIQAISEQSRIVRLPLNRLSNINKIAKAIACLEQDYQREPTDQEIAEQLDISEVDIRISNLIKKNQLSFDAPISSDCDDGVCLYDVTSAENFPSPDTGLLNESLKIDIARALKKLSSREASIITMSFGLNNSPRRSLHEISQEHGMSSERIRQIRQSVFHKLKHIMREKSFYQ